MSFGRYVVNPAIEKSKLVVSGNGSEVMPAGGPKVTFNS